jgi:hypothetical protein
VGGATNKGKTWSWGVEAAENQLNTLIERRAREADEANYRARAWAESVEKYNLRCAAQRREEWIVYHRAKAARLRSTMGALASEHERAASELEAGEGGRR